MKNDTNKYSDEQENLALEKLQSKAKIVKYYGGRLVLAQSDSDFRNKCNKIDRGDIRGFYSINDAVQISGVL